MSHISRIELEIRDLQSLKDACKKLGFQFMEGQTRYQWYGKWVGNQPLPDGISEEDLGKCSHAVRVPDEAVYEIGVVRKGNGYILLWDSWVGGGLQKHIGKDAEVIKQVYAVESVKREARRKGYRLTEKRMKNGIRLSMSL